MRDAAKRRDPTRIPMGGVDKCLICGWQGRPDEPHGCPRYRDEQPAASLLLSAEERERFATWLEADAAADEALAEAMRDLPTFAKVLHGERLKDAEAKRRIARQLRMTEDANV